MKINKTVILDTDDIMKAIKLYLEKVHSIDPETVCNFTIYLDKEDSADSTISVTLRQEVK